RRKIYRAPAPAPGTSPQARLPSPLRFAQPWILASCNTLRLWQVIQHKALVSEGQLNAQGRDVRQLHRLIVRNLARDYCQRQQVGNAQAQRFHCIGNLSTVLDRTLRYAEELGC